MSGKNRNAKAMLQALENIRAVASVCATKGGAMNYAHIVEAVDKALAAPRRNCDFGTAEEQSKRFLGFCGKMESCDGCPLMKASCCELAWAQMPYKKGVAE